MTGWSWVIFGYLLTGGTWVGYIIWTRPAPRDEA